MVVTETSAVCGDTAVSVVNISFVEGGIVVFVLVAVVFSVLCADVRSLAVDEDGMDDDEMLANSDDDSETDCV